jgi:hypothetical protein
VNKSLVLRREYSIQSEGNVQMVQIINCRVFLLLKRLKETIIVLDFCVIIREVICMGECISIHIMHLMKPPGFLSAGEALTTNFNLIYHIRNEFLSRAVPAFYARGR